MGKVIVRGLKWATLAAANRMVAPGGYTTITKWELNSLSSCNPLESFQLAGAEYPFFIHRYNCGRHPRTATERTVELALADRWLDRVSPTELIEVGAVTPYYWPRRVTNVADPADPHPLVTNRAAIMDLDLTGRTVLCLSTLEHIGSGEYGLTPDTKALHAAVEKLFVEAKSFLVTVPSGYTPQADEALFERNLPGDVNAYYLVRSGRPPYWQEVRDSAAARLPYGRPEPSANGFGANAVVVWERGGLLNGVDHAAKGQ